MARVETKGEDIQIVREVRGLGRNQITNVGGPANGRALGA
jgi:hypothetical protein